MDIKLPSSSLKFVPLSLKMHWSALFRVLKIKLLNGRGQPPSTPPCTPLPPPPPHPSCARWKAVCYTLLCCYLFYRACKQALLGYPEVRGWGREKGKSCRQSALGELVRKLSILENSVQCRRCMLFVYIPLCGASVFRAVLHACELDAWYPASNTADLICISEGVLQWRTPHKWSTV